MKKNIRMIVSLLPLTLFLSGCVITTPSAGVKPLPPGQAKKYTGCNPRSGKCKPMPTAIVINP